MSYICYIAFIESDYFLWVKKATKYLYQKVYFSTYIFQQRTANNETRKSESLKIKKKLQEDYLEFYYKEKLASSEKLTLYKHFDRNYSLAPYLSKIKNHNFREALTKIRI